MLENHRAGHVFFAQKFEKHMRYKMEREIRTVFDDFDETNEKGLLKHIATMMARNDKQYQLQFITKSLRDLIAMEMLTYDQKHDGHTYKITVKYAGNTESGTFRASRIRSLVDMSDVMDNETYLAEVIIPTSAELAASLMLQVNDTKIVTDCDIEVGPYNG